MFSGFRTPKENWSKLPHDLIDALDEIETIGELKVILYILRHTWGFHDDQKKITVDEFMNGRKRRDGSRIDKGTGLTAPTIRDGLNRAIKHGFIAVQTDESDLARVKKFYSLMEKDFPSGVKNISIGDKEVLPRTEKDTFDNKQEKESGIASRAVMTAYEQTFGLMSSTMQAQKLYDDVDEFGETAVTEALHAARTSGARSYGWVSARLNGRKADAAKKDTASDLWDNEIERYMNRLKKWQELTPKAQQIIRKVGGQSRLRMVKEGFELEQLKREVASYV